jgi:hypothetical protein
MRYFYRFKMVLVICSLALLLGMLMGIGIVVLLVPSALEDVRELSRAPSFTPIQAASNGMDLQEATFTPTARTVATPTSSPTQAPTSTPTSSLTAMATTAPTATALPPSTPVPTSDPTITAALERIAQAEAALRSGQLEAVNNQQDGGRSSVTIRFDFGSEQLMPRLRSIATTENTREDSTTERIVVGEHAWQRQSGSSWTKISDQPDVVEQVQEFLPDVDEAANPEVETDGTITVVQWYDAERDANVTVHLDADSLVLRELRRVSRKDGSVLTVTYPNWNSFVDIVSPEGT